MAFPTAVNDQITDSTAQSSASAPVAATPGDAAATAMGNLFIATSQALSNAAHNATNNQQQSYITAQAATTMGVSTLLSLDTAAAGEATAKIFDPQSSSGQRAMAYPTAVNSQITDAVTSGAAMSAPANAAMLDLVLTNALGISMHNAVARQQNASISAGAAVTAACARLLQARQGKAVEVAAPPEPAEVGAAASAEGSAAIEDRSLEAMKQDAAGQAYQSVAQSVAIAVQDAADNLRNMSTLSTTAVGVAMAQFLATRDPTYAAAITKLQEMNMEAIGQFNAVGAAAAKVLKDFPSG